ncbi:MAG: hypothetical protein M3Y72_10115, partial [Acidobacteriota bacterium]|nr:hypothetical protein [Acidobacteriota bacterium]
TDPRVHRHGDLSPPIRMCTARLDWTVITGVRGCSISNDSQLVIDFRSYKRHARWAFPCIPIRMKVKSASVVPIGPFMRVPCDRLERKSNNYQQENIRPCEKRL